MIFSKYHLPYNPNLKQFSRNLRNKSELAEVLLWNELKADKFLGLSFNRQKPILNYIADFYCKEKRIVIEIDGASHFTEEAVKYDTERDRQMQVLGLKVLRILDSDVRNDINAVLRQVEAFLTPPNPLKEGELFPSLGGVRGGNALFDEPKYRGLLEGLEAVEILKSELEIDNDVFRTDAEYFDKENLQLIKRIHKIGYKKIDEFSFVTDGIHTAINYSTESNVNLISATSPKENCFDLSRQVFISEDAHKLNPRTALKIDDVIISTVGTIGNCAVVDETILPANSDRHVGIIRIEKDFLPRFVSTFLLTKYGRFQTNRESTGNVQLNLYIIKLKGLKVPTLSNTFQTQIEETVKLAHTNQQHSKTLYTEAESILLEELGLAHWQPTIKNNNTKTLKESFLQSGRIDAEYYQPKYDEIIKQISQFEHLKIGEIVSIQKSIEPGSEAYQTEGIPFIRVADLSKNGITESSVYLSKEEFADFKLMPKKDTILLSKDGSVGIAYKVNEEVQGITSSAILHLTVKHKKVLPDYLCLVLNSIIVKMQAEKDAGGSIIQHWKPSEIEQVIIPILDHKTQTTISQKIQESFALQAQSKQLLAAAKTAVEIAIEQGEDEAMEYLAKYK